MPLKIKRSGVWWTVGAIYVKQGGDWAKVTKGWVKHNGLWQLFYDGRPKPKPKPKPAPKPQPNPLAERVRRILERLRRTGAGNDGGPSDGSGFGEP